MVGLIFLGLFVFSAIFSLAAFLFGHDHDFSADHDMSVGHDSDAGGGMPSIFSGRVISLFLLGFSGTGFVTTYVYGMGAVTSSLAGLGSGFVLGALAYFFLVIFYREQATSSASSADYVGLDARVSTAIPAGGTGEVSVAVKEQLRTIFATSVDGKAIPEGRQVKIEKMSGGTATVRLVTKQD